MNPEIVDILSQADFDGRLLWHRPEIRKLTISLDTEAGGGSAGDGVEQDPGEDFPSDLRLKRDIRAVQDALSSLLALKGVTYRYDTDRYPEMGLNSGPQIGFIAQELEQVYPEVVTTRDNGFKAVNYAQLVPVLVEAVKEQQSMIADLREQVNALQHAAKAVR